MKNEKQTAIIKMASIAIKKTIPEQGLTGITDKGIELVICTTAPPSHV